MYWLSAKLIKLTRRVGAWLRVLKEKSFVQLFNENIQ